MKKNHMLMALLLTGALLLAGCTGSIADQPDQREDNTAPGAVESDSAPVLDLPSETPQDITPDRSERKPIETLPPGLETVEIPPGKAETGEVPVEMMDAIISDLLERSGAEREAIQVVRAEAVVWNDGSLGCPKPGEFYIQMLINGYRVVLEVEGIEYDYRVSDKGSFKLCEGGNMAPVIPPEAGEENPLVKQAKEDLAERLRIQSTDIELLKIEEVTWRDGSLGCPQPGMMYTQALVNGSLILLEHGGSIYQYHSGGGGAPFLCENPPNNTEEMFTPDVALPGFGDQ